MIIIIQFLIKVTFWPELAFGLIIIHIQESREKQFLGPSFYVGDTRDHRDDSKHYNE